MSTWIICSFAFLVIILFFLVPQWKKQNKKAFWVGAAFAVCGYVILSFGSFGYFPPSLYKPFQLLFQRLKG